MVRRLESEKGILAPTSDRACYTNGPNCIPANQTRGNVLLKRDACKELFSLYVSASEKLTVAKNIHWKLEVGKFQRWMRYDMHLNLLRFALVA